jgi:hypothetical protein
MNALKNTWRQLVRRRLWPVALLLVAALVAVPVVLAKPATPAPAPAPAVAAAPAATPAQSYVKLASDDATPSQRRRVLGKSKDPFEPAPLPKVKKRHHAAKAGASAAATATATATPAASDTSPAPASTGAGDTTPSAPVATATPAPTKTYPANSVEVRFGKVSGGSMKKGTLTRLETLPSASSPLVVFMGFAHGGKDAVFMLTGTVTAEGDGRCDPNPQSCETLLLRKGQTEFLTFKGTKADGEYELDLNDLHTTRSASASASALVAKATATATATPTATAAATATP